MAKLRLSVVVSLLAATAAPAAFAAHPYCDGGVPSEVAFRTDGSASAAETVRACTQSLMVLVAQGWKPGPTIVRVAANPFDATSPPVAIPLPLDRSPDDNAFDFTEGVVRRALASSPRSVPVEALARSVAAHLAAPAARRRMAWESDWIERVERGDLVTTAIPELLWRHGGHGAVRSAAAGPWPESALRVLKELGCDDPLTAAAELVAAALLKPEAIGFGRGHRVDPRAFPARAGSTEVELPGAGVRFLPLPTGAGTVGVQAIRSEGTVTWVALRYVLSGEVDAVPVPDGRELAVPLQGVDWAALVIVGLHQGASASLNLRAIPDYPQRLTRWDFVASEGRASLAWETGSHGGLIAYVVEVLAQSEGGAWSVERREIIPVADDGGEPYGYAFVDAEGGDVAGYRLLALTADGLLAELSTFPVPSD